MNRVPARQVATPALALALGLLMALAVPAAAQPNVEGQWATLPYLMPINPIHVALMRTGKVVILAGTENDPTVTSRRAAIWNPAAGSIQVKDILWDFYCNGFNFLPDGRLLVVGGNLRYSPNTGLNTTSIFDPATESFTQVQDMAHGRWYPSNVALGDGRSTTFSGVRETVEYAINDTVEIFDVATGWSPEHQAPFTPTYYYPWMHLLPNGKVFVSGNSPASHIFDPATITWEQNVAFTNFGQDRITGTSVLLPLLPELDYKARVMIMGGQRVATNTAEIIDLSESPLTWRWLPSMSKARSNMDAVILPTGHVLAMGGAAQDGVVGTASLEADLFDPVTQTWSPAGSAAYPRMYHSTALLLPDATVWTAGSNPVAGTWEPHMEIYSPAYLFTTNGSGQAVPAPRPTIAAAPTRVGYDAPFTVKTPDAAEIASVVLIRPGASTHAFDMEQRLVGLTFSVSQPDTLAVTSPPDGNIAPPGYYMLFLVDTQGVPSVAKFVQLSVNPTNQPPTGQIVSPAGDLAIAVGTSVPFEGAGTDLDGLVSSYSWTFPTGTPAVSSAATPGQVVFPTPGRFVVTFTVTDNSGENDPSPPSRIITVEDIARGGSTTRQSERQGPGVEGPLRRSGRPAP